MIAQCCDTDSVSGVLHITTDFNVHVLPLGMETHVFDSSIHGNHVFKDFWMPLINKELVCAQESENPHNLYVVAIN